MIATNTHGVWPALSLSGASGLVLPLLTWAMWLLARHSTEGARMARRWLLASACAVAVVVTSKIAFYGWGTGIRAWNLTAPSGHTVLALLLWPALLGLLVPSQRRALRALAIAAGVLLGGACGLSRLMIHAHPLSEVVAGLILGGLTAAIAVHALRGQQLPLPRTALAARLPLVLGLCLVAMPISLRTEPWLAELGAHLAGREKPVKRKAWLLEYRDPPRTAETAK